MIEPPPRLAKRPRDARGYGLTIGGVTRGEFKWDANILILIRCNFKQTVGGKLGYRIKVMDLEQLRKCARLPRARRRAFND